MTKDEMTARIRRMNRLAEMAEADGYRVWDLGVWTKTGPCDPAAERVCDLAEYGRARAKRDLIDNWTRLVQEGDFTEGQMRQTLTDQVTGYLDLSMEDAEAYPPAFEWATGMEFDAFCDQSDGAPSEEERARAEAAWLEVVNAAAREWLEA